MGWKICDFCQTKFHRQENQEISFNYNRRNEINKLKYLLYIFFQQFYKIKLQAKIIDLVYLIRTTLYKLKIKSTTNLQKYNINCGKKKYNKTGPAKTLIFFSLRTKYNYALCQSKAYKNPIIAYYCAEHWIR